MRKVYFAWGCFCKLLTPARIAVAPLGAGNTVMGDASSPTLPSSATGSRFLGVSLQLVQAKAFDARLADILGRV